MGDLLLAQQKIDRDHALARKQCSVETGNEAGPCRHQQSDGRLPGLCGDIHPQPGCHRGELLVGAGSPVVMDGYRLRLPGCVMKERFRKAYGTFYLREARMRNMKSIPISGGTLNHGDQVGDREMSPPIHESSHESCFQFVMIRVNSWTKSSVLSVLLLLAGCTNKDAVLLTQSRDALEQKQFDQAIVKADEYLQKHPREEGSAEALYLRPGTGGAPIR